MKAAAGVVALVGLATLLLGLRDQPARFTRHGPTTFVNDDRPGIDPHNSPSLAADPARPGLVVVADRSESPLACSLSVSPSGGATWRPLPLPLAEGAGNCFWPSVAFDPAGRLLVLYTATGGRYNLPVGVWLQRFAPGDPDPRPDGPPVAIAGRLAYHARLAVAPRPPNGPPRVVASWVQAGPATADNPLGFGADPNPVVLARSDDGGRTFSPPVAVSDPAARVVQPTVVLGPGDRVVVVAYDLGDDLFDYESRHGGVAGPPPPGRWRVLAWTSGDGGARFGPAVVVAGDLAIPQRILASLGPAPALAVDQSTGRVFAAWDAGTGDGRDVSIAWSDDGGASWSAPRAVEAGPGAQFLPAVAVAADGRVDVVFYDRRRDPGDVMAEVVLASSWDGGRTFASTVVSDRPFDSSVGLVPGILGLGSQLALVSGPDRVLAAWADTRRGSETTGAQDLGVATVEVSPGRGRRAGLAGGGAALLAAACGLAWAGIRRPGPRRTGSDRP